MRCGAARRGAPAPPAHPRAIPIVSAIPSAAPPVNDDEAEATIPDALSPAEALRADEARAPVVTPAMEERWAVWLSLVTTLDRLAALPAARRARYARRAAPLWAAVAGRTEPAFGETVEVDGAAFVGAAGALARWTRQSPTLPQLQVLLGALTRVELDGALHLAHCSLAALRRLTGAGDGRVGYVLGQEGRVMRTLGLLAEAGRCFADTARIAQRARDGWLRGRVALGRAALYHTRGNYPAVRAECRIALVQGRKHREFLCPAHIELASAAMAARDHDTAFAHAWEAFGTAAHNPIAQAEALLMLAELCRRIGHHAAAAHACRVALSLRPPRVHRLAVLRNLTRAYMGEGRLAAASAVGEELERSLGGVSGHHEDVRSRLALADLHAACGDAPGARALRQEVVAQSRQRGFSELRVRAEDALVAMDVVEAPPPNPLADGQLTLSDTTDDVIRQLVGLPEDSLDMVVT